MTKEGLMKFVPRIFDVSKDDFETYDVIFTLSTRDEILEFMIDSEIVESFIVTEQLFLINQRRVIVCNTLRGLLESMYINFKTPNYTIKIPSFNTVTLTKELQRR